MPAPVVLIAGLAALTMALWALVSGKIMAGSRGFKANYYSREDEPFLYYCFLTAYVLLGVFLLSHAL